MMRQRMYAWTAALASLVVVIAGTSVILSGQTGAKNGEWRTYGGDVGNTRYSPLDQINASNFKNLEVAWRFKTDSLGPRPEFQFEGTPLMVGGVVYSTGGTRRAVVALDAATGEVGLHSTPLVARDVVIVGAAHRSGGVPRSRMNVKGYVRGFDVRTGKRLWIFHTIPGLREFGNDTWERDSWSYTGNAGVWGQISVDEELGLAYLP